MSERRPLLKRYNPTLGEILSEALIEKPVSIAHRAMGANDRQAALEGSRVASNFDQLTGIRSALSGAQRLLNGNVNTQNVLSAASLALPFAGRAASPLLRRAAANTPTTPVVRNSLYGGTPFKPIMHTPQTNGVPQYAFRNVNNADEIADIQRSGYMRPRKEAGQKYFSVTNNPVGNPANLSTGTPVLRVKTANIAATQPVSRRHIEIWNPQTQRFMQLPRRSTK